jgi:hypothetical protein
MQGIRRQKLSGWAHVRRAIYTRVSTDQGLEQDFNSQDGFGRLQLFDAGRCQRHDLHVDTSGVHFGYAFVAKVAKQRDEFEIAWQEKAVVRPDPYPAVTPRVDAWLFCIRVTTMAML